MYHYIPLPRNEHFVGRTDILRLLNQKLFSSYGRRRVCLYGLGGVGKTQVALRIALEAKDNLGYTVIWLQASNNASFQQACTEVVNCFGISTAGQGDPKTALQEYLNSYRTERWLLVIDNIDDMSTLLGSSEQPKGIRHFLPDDNTCGCILFTTRSYDVAERVAPDAMVELKELSPGESKLYLQQRLQLDSQDDTAVTELLALLEHLPLAITQAIAYLRRNKISIPRYLELLRMQSNMAEMIEWEFYDKDRYEGSQNAVALTWQISFRQICGIDTAAAELLRFISRIEPKAIPRSILPNPGSELQLINAIGTLLGYAFLVARDKGDIYDMHSLVHLATQTWIKTEGDANTAMVSAVAHLSKIFPEDGWENYEIWEQYIPHGIRLLHDDNSRSKAWLDLGYKVGRCCQRVVWRRETAARILEDVVSARISTLVDDHPDLLDSQLALADAYWILDEGSRGNAIELLEYVVSIRKVALNWDHPDLLSCQTKLAGAYREKQEFPKAIELLEYVASAQRMTLPKDDRESLYSLRELAALYQQNSQPTEAIELLEYVVAIQDRTLDQDHPDLIDSQFDLGQLYRRNGQESEASRLLNHVFTADHSRRFQASRTRYGMDI